MAKSKGPTKGPVDPDAGLSSVMPSVPAKLDSNEPIPLLEFQMDKPTADEWKKRIEASDTEIKTQSQTWKSLLDSYNPAVKPAGTQEEINANLHFRNIHTKLGQMFVRLPKVVLSYDSPSPGDDLQPLPNGAMVAKRDIIPVKQAYLNKILGRHGINALRTFGELNFDILASTGIGCSKIGYRSVTKYIEEPDMMPDPNFVPPMGAPAPMGGDPMAMGGPPAPEMAPPMPPAGPPMPGAPPAAPTVMGLPPQAPMVPKLDAMGQPMMKKTPITIFEEYFWRRFSAWKLITDISLFSTRHDEDASFMGMHFTMLPAQAEAMFGIKPGTLKANNDDKRYKTKESQGLPKVVSGSEIFAKASLYLPEELNPQRYIQIVFIDGVNDGLPVVYRYCTDQSVDEYGKLTPDSITRFPIRVTTIRDLTDNQFPAADSAFTNNLVKQVNTNRRQGVLLRDAAIGKILYDTGALEDGDVEKVKNAKPGEWIGVAPGKLAQGKDAVATPVAQVTRTNDDYRLDAMIMQNIDETLGISANSAGAALDTVRSAAEIKSVESGVAGRMETEQGRIIDSFLEGVEILDTLISRYTTEMQWAEYTGVDGAKRWTQWNGKMVMGKWLYDISPDSQLRADTAQDRQLSLNAYNVMAADPMVNRVPMLRRLAQQFYYDPTTLILDPAMQPPNPAYGGMANKQEAGKTGGQEGDPNAAAANAGEEGKR